MSKVYDCCLFFNELDMLETRFHILNAVIDHFVICEAEETHSGQPKPLDFLENWERFKPWHNKIIYVNAGPLSDDKRNSWQREHFHRSQIANGLIGAKPDDYIIVGDCDEIANPDAVRKVEANRYEGAILEMDMYYYDLNHRVHQGWGIGMMRHKLYDDPNDVRMGNGRMFPHILNGGWHFSYFGGPQAIVDKVSSFMHHADPNIRDMPRDVDWVAQRVSEGRDLFDRGGMRIERVPLSETLPQYILDNVDKYRALGWGE